MKVILKCKYGKNLPGDTVDLEKEKAQKFIDDGAATLANQNTDLTAEEAKKEHTMLKKQVAELQKENEALVSNQTALEAKIAELEKSTKK